MNAGRVEALEARRFLSAGDLDPTFGKNGIATQSFGGEVNFAKVAVESDQKIIVAMSLIPDGKTEPEFVLSRFSGSGQIDKTFGNGGKTILLLNDYFTSKPVIDSQNRIPPFPRVGNSCDLLPTACLI